MFCMDFYMELTPLGAICMHFYGGRAPLGSPGGHLYAFLRGVHSPGLPWVPFVCMFTWCTLAWALLGTMCMQPTEPAS